MMKRLFHIAILFLLVLTVSAPAAPVSADSLWADNSSAANLFGDHKAHQVGDVITIIISESSTAVRSGSTSNSKTASTSLDAGTGIFHFLASASGGASDSVKTQGSIANSNNVTAKITAQVVQVDPSGNLIISGTQTIKQNTEEQKITLTGTVRPDDVSADNTVLSTYVANAQIRIDGKGPISSKQRQGILTQIFNILF